MTLKVSLVDIVFDFRAMYGRWADFSVYVDQCVRLLLARAMPNCPMSRIFLFEHPHRRVLYTPWFISKVSSRRERNVVATLKSSCCWLHVDVDVGVDAFFSFSVFKAICMEHIPGLNPPLNL